MRICVVALPGECLRVKADVVLFAGVTLCDPYLSALEAFEKTRCTNPRILLPLLLPVF